MAVIADTSDRLTDVLQLLDANISSIKLRAEHVQESFDVVSLHLLSISEFAVVVSSMLLHHTDGTGDDVAVQAEVLTLLPLMCVAVQIHCLFIGDVDNLKFRKDQIK